jgi:hypothetical protein
MARAYTLTDWSTHGPRVLELKKAGKSFRQIEELIGVKQEAIRAWFNKHGKGEILPGQITTPQDFHESEPVEVLAGQMCLDDRDTATLPEASPVENGMSATADIVPVIGEIVEHLSPVEVQTLAHYEHIIAQGIKTFVEVGNALVAIRDQHLYRESYTTFEDYLRQRWDLSRPYAYQLMEASVVVERVSAVADIVPVNEAQARPLATLPVEQQAAAWKEAVETAPPSGITAKHVQATVKRVKAQSTGTKEPPTPELNPNGMSSQKPLRIDLQERLFEVLKSLRDPDALHLFVGMYQWVEKHAIRQGDDIRGQAVRDHLMVIRERLTRSTWLSDRSSDLATEVFGERLEMWEMVE